MELPGTRHRFCALLIGAAFLIVSGAGTIGARPVFDHSLCRQLPLTDAHSGNIVRGAEAISVSDDRSVLYLAAYDRRTKQQNGVPPQGGLYLADTEDLVSGDGLQVTPLAAGKDLPGGFRPHGLANVEFDGDSARLAVINRRYFQGRDKRQVFKPSIEVFVRDRDGWRHETTVEHRDFCSANDLDFLDPTTLMVTVHRSKCAGFTVRDDLMGLPGGYLLRVDLEDGGVTRTPVLPLDFANGIAVDRKRGRVYVAETKAGVVSRFEIDDLDGADRLPEPVRIAVDGYPDNITIGTHGRVVAAVHPALFRLAAYRYRWFGQNRSGSKVVSTDEKGAVTVLFDDYSGRLYSAASEAVYVGNSLVAGSVGDDGLLACRRITEE